MDRINGGRDTWGGKHDMLRRRSRIPGSSNGQTRKLSCRVGVVLVYSGVELFVFCPLRSRRSMLF